MESVQTLYRIGANFTFHLFIPDQIGDDAPVNLGIGDIERMSAAYRIPYASTHRVRLNGNTRGVGSAFTQDKAFADEHRLGIGRPLQREQRGLADTASVSSFEIDLVQVLAYDALVVASRVGP